MTELQAWIIAGAAILTALATVARVAFDWRRDQRERR